MCSGAQTALLSQPFCMKRVLFAAPLARPSLLAGLLAVVLMADSHAAPDLRESVVGNWQWQERQFYLFAPDQTGIMSQDGKTFRFRWRVEGKDIPITFLDAAGQELFTWNATADPNPLFLRLQTMPGRSPVQIKRVPKIPFR